MFPIRRVDTPLDGNPVSPVVVRLLLSLVFLVFLLLPSVAFRAAAAPPPWRKGSRHDMQKSYEDVLGNAGGHVKQHTKEALLALGVELPPGCFRGECDGKGGHVMRTLDGKNTEGSRG